MLCLTAAASGQPSPSPLDPLHARARAAALEAVKAGHDGEGRAWIDAAERELETRRSVDASATIEAIATIYARLGEHDHAAATWRKLLQHSRDRVDPNGEFNALMGLGRATLAGHDPAAAIAPFEAAVAAAERASLDTRAAVEGLITSLMTQASSPGDAFVQRAFAAAASVSGRGPDHIAQVAKTLAPREVLLVYFVGRERAFAWSVTTDRVMGFDLPSPAELDDTVQRMRERIDRHQTELLGLLADEFTPALLGPVLPRLGDFDRIIVAPDGPLVSLPFAALPLGPDGPSLGRRISIKHAGGGDVSLGADPFARNAHAAFARAVVALALIGGLVVWLRRRR